MENISNITIKDFICEILSENKKLKEELESAHNMKEFWCSEYEKTKKLNKDLGTRIIELEGKGNENNK